MKKALLILAAALAVTAIDLNAQTKPIAPKRGEIVFIAKLRTQPSLPIDFFRSYIIVDKRGESPTTAYAIIDVMNTFASVRTYKIGALNQFGYFAIRPGKDRVFHFAGLQINLFDSNELYITIPLGVSMTIPDDVQFVYLGSFVYRYSDEYFTKSELVRLDEFDDVLKELKAAIGPDVKLIRAPLTALE